MAASPILGGLAGVVAVTGFGMIGLGAWREMTALMALRSVDTLRASFAGTNAVARARCRSCLAVPSA